MGNNILEFKEKLLKYRKCLIFKKMTPIVIGTAITVFRPDKSPRVAKSLGRNHHLWETSGKGPYDACTKRGSHRTSQADDPYDFPLPVEIISRSLKNAPLRRFPHPSSLRRTSKYDSLLRISGALHLGIFERPRKIDFFSKLLAHRMAPLIITGKASPSRPKARTSDKAMSPAEIGKKKNIAKEVSKYYDVSVKK